MLVKHLARDDSNLIRPELLDAVTAPILAKIETTQLIQQMH